MRKYKSTDSHYLELATSSFNFRSLKKATPISASPALLKAKIIPLSIPLEDKTFCSTKEDLNTSVFSRFPEDIFITKQCSTDALSVFGSLNAYKQVVRTVSDTFYNVVHCFLEEKNQQNHISSLSSMIKQENGTQSEKLGKILEEFYVKREELNESQSNSGSTFCFSAKEESECGNSSLSQPISQFSEKQELKQIERLLQCSTPQILFRRVTLDNKQTVIRSIHFNKALLSHLETKFEDIQIGSALRKAIPDMIKSSNISELTINYIQAINSSDPQPIFSHTFTTASGRQFDAQCRYEKNSFHSSQFIMLQFLRISACSSSESLSTQCEEATINKKRSSPFLNEEGLLDDIQMRVIRSVFEFTQNDNGEKPHKILFGNENFTREKVKINQ